MPRNITIDIVPMTARVLAAFFACGRRNACTPSAIASTPVRAVAPDENARAIKKRDNVVLELDRQVGGLGAWDSRRDTRTNPARA